MNCLPITMSRISRTNASFDFYTRAWCADLHLAHESSPLARVAQHDGHRFVVLTGETLEMSRIKCSTTATNTNPPPS